MDRPECDTSPVHQSVVFLCDDSCPADEQLRAVVETSVGLVFSVRSQDFGSITRGRARAALARQVAMYLSHVACRRTFTDVGRIFARDRTTVAHACGVVEDLRDDQRFDRILDLLEAIVRFKLSPRGEN